LAWNFRFRASNANASSPSDIRKNEAGSGTAAVTVKTPWDPALPLVVPVAPFTSTPLKLSAKVKLSELVDPSARASHADPR
jgi:hypothetical protein